MEMKATHKLVSLITGSAWDLADTEHGLYYKMTDPLKFDRWDRAAGTILSYINHKDFSCKQINKFKGNK